MACSHAAFQCFKTIGLRTMPKFVTLPRRRRRRRDMEAMVIRDQNAEQHRRPSIQSPTSISDSHLNSYAQNLQV